MLVELVIFSIFCVKKLKNANNGNKFGVKFNKKMFFFEFAPKGWLTVLFPRLTVDQHFVAKL